MLKPFHHLCSSLASISVAVRASREYTRMAGCTAGKSAARFDQATDSIPL